MCRYRRAGWIYQISRHLPDDRAILSDEPDTATATMQGTVRVRVCDESYLRAGRHCPHAQWLTFDRGTAPRQTCDVHR